MYRRRVFPTSLRKYDSSDAGGVSLPYLSNSAKVEVDNTSRNGPIVATSKNSPAFFAEMLWIYALRRELIVR